ncbi:AmmeMemoRadiSam system protein A [bacterium]|nr:AmmeMemoRadiSam system protein A [bacterium]
MNYYTLLAKSAVENYIKNKNIIEPPSDLPKQLREEKSGVFVTIEKQGEKGKILRGCIGTYLPTKENIAKEIISNAIAAAINDYRFNRIEKEELPFLKYTVSVLDKPILVKNISELNVKKYGILVRNEYLTKSGLLLPDLEGVDTIEKQISIACQKAGINPSEEKIIIYKFKVKKYD